ncbi:MAG: PEP/pyruvate-binding domain-containing protein [Rhizonema sp. NSF051]|nr:PEP/pyruvate-binding domain-containing protein [Rhizonema sp. NSF051]
MDKLYWLDQIKLQDRTKVGDKAFHLSQTMQRGYPVIPGFVVSATVLQEFLETLNSSEALVVDLPDSSLHLDVDNWRQLQQVAGRLRQEITTAVLPSQWVKTIFNAASQWETECLIFRPSFVISATSKMSNLSGLLESQICGCDLEAIATALKRIWSQIFRAKSLLYWQRKGVNLRQVNLAVLVQPLRNALASGLLYAHSEGWEIQATWGLGIAIANGEVLPDVYYIQPETGAVLERHMGNKMITYGVDDTLLVAQQSLHTPVLKSDLTNLVVYPLEEAKHQQYALQEEYLRQLISLAHQFVRELGANFTLKWTISEETIGRKLYLTHVNTSQSAIPDEQLLIGGLGASPGRVTATAYVLDNSIQKLEQLPKKVVLVASVIAPDVLLMVQDSCGIITEQGGLTSHAAILARELGIPAVVNASGATSMIQTGERLLVDGDKGEIYRVNKGTSEVGEVGEMNRQGNENKGENLPTPQIQNSLPVIATELLVNLSQPNLIKRVQSLPVDGVGLLRSELMVMTILEGQHPNTWLQERKTQLLERWYEQVIQFASAFAPRPIFYRSLDWRSHELRDFSHTSSFSSQPMLGNRGTFSYLENPAVFELELEALAAVQKSGYTNIRLLLPFVRTVEEFSFCRQKVEQANLTQVPQFQLWIMAEVPSVLFLLPEYVKAGVAGISIGTNDLTQLLLGVDREQGQLARAFDERHPVVMNMIAQLIQMAKNAGIPCSICGQAPALYPEIIEQLVQWGITSISVEPEAIERTYQAIARAEQRLILKAARQILQ